eukprot:12507191-Heterocapsa_arctica.AAC.1
MDERGVRQRNSLLRANLGQHHQRNAGLPGGGTPHQAQRMPLPRASPPSPTNAGIGPLPLRCITRDRPTARQRLA